MKAKSDKFEVFTIDAANHNGVYSTSIHSKLAIDITMILSTLFTIVSVTQVGGGPVIVIST